MPLPTNDPRLKLTLPTSAAEALYDIYANVIFNDIDFFIVNIGREGLGKSTLAIQQWRQLDNFREYWGYQRSWNTNHLAYSPEAYSGLLSKPTQYDGEVVLLDEAGTAMYNRDSHSDVNKELNRIIMQCRYQKRVHILNLPNFFALDREVRARRVGLVFRVTGEPVPTHVTAPSGVNVNYIQIKKGRFDMFNSVDARKFYKDPKTGWESDPHTPHRGLHFHSCKGTREWEEYETCSKQFKQESIKYSHDKITAKRRIGPEEAEGVTKLSDYLDKHPEADQRLTEDLLQAPHAKDIEEEDE